TADLFPCAGSGDSCNGVRPLCNGGVGGKGGGCGCAAPAPTGTVHPVGTPGVVQARTGSPTSLGAGGQRTDLTVRADAASGVVPAGAAEPAGGSLSATTPGSERESAQSGPALPPPVINTRGGEQP